MSIGPFVASKLPEINFIKSDDVVFILRYKSLQTNLCPITINRADFQNKDVIVKAIGEILKQANFFPKNLSVKTAILIQEE